MGNKLPNKHMLEKLQKWNKVFKKKMQEAKKPGRKKPPRTKWRSIDD